MRVVLITLPREGEVRAYVTPARYFNPNVRYMPLGLLSVASGVIGHQVTILDPASYGWSIEETVSRIEKAAPDVLGISAVTLRVWALAEVLRRTSAKYKVVGGPHVTNYAQESLGLGATAVIRGDGDFALADWLTDHCPPGIYDGYVGDLDRLPPLDFSLLPVQDYALTAQAAGGTMLGQGGLRWPVFTSKGCPYRCRFCENLERRYRTKGAQRVAAEMWMGVKHGASTVHAQDDMFHLKGGDICRMLIASDFPLPWSARVRADTPRATLALMARAGCRRVHVGLEALDDALLAWTGKGFNLERIERFLRDCREEKLAVLAYLIVGLPGETAAYREGLQPRLKALGIQHVYLNILYPFPHTDYYAALRESGVFERDYWREFAADPSPQWELPLPRSPQEQRELEAFVGV